MSHKIAKARRAAERNAATPQHMHTLIIEANRQQRRVNAHKLKPSKLRKHTPKIGTFIPPTLSPLIVERPIRALWRKLNGGKAIPTPPAFVHFNLRWSKAEMDYRVLEA